MKFTTLIEALKSKGVRYGGYAAFVTILVLVGLIVLNLIIQQLPAEIDFTENQIYSLSDQTKEVLENLDEEIRIYALYKIGRENDDVTTILRKYEQLSSMVHVEYVDPEKNPTFVSKFETEDKEISEGSLIVVRGENYKTISPFDLYDVSYSREGQPQVTGVAVEQRVTSAILYVGSGYSPKIYQLIGHKEYTLQDVGLVDALTKENYEIQNLNLASADAVPDDTALLLVMSPEIDFTPPERDKILDYLDDGGRAVFLFDFYSFERKPNIDAVLKSYGLRLKEGVVMEGDPSRLYSTDNPFFLAPILEDHPMLAPLRDNKLNILFPNSMALEELDIKKRNMELTPLLSTSDKSWLRTEQNGNVNKIPSDLPGPHTVAYSVKDKFNEKEGVRLVVCGNGRFLTPLPPYGQLKGNIEFFINSLSWVSNRSETISIRSKSLFTLPMRMSGLQVFIYSGIVVILIPALILIAGLVIWLRRRNL
jgi:ABC-2 type transport system permease protein